MTFPDAPCSWTLQAADIVLDLDELEGDVVQETKWLAQNCTFRDGVDPQGLVDIISSGSADGGSPPGDHHPCSPFPDNRHPGAGRSAGEDGWDGSPQEGKGAHHSWGEGVGVLAGGADLGGRSTSSTAERSSHAGRQESVGGSGRAATPPGSAWKEPEVSSNSRDDALRADEAGRAQGQRYTV